MNYEIIVSKNAENDLDGFIKYLLFEKKNSQAASNVLDDFEGAFLARCFCEDIERVFERKRAGIPADLEPFVAEFEGLACLKGLRAREVDGVEQDVGVEEGVNHICSQSCPSSAHR